MNLAHNHGDGGTVCISGSIKIKLRRARCFQSNTDQKKPSYLLFNPRLSALIRVDPRPSLLRRFSISSVCAERCGAGIPARSRPPVRLDPLESGSAGCKACSTVQEHTRYSACRTTLDSEREGQGQKTRARPIEPPTPTRALPSYPGHATDRPDFAFCEPSRLLRLRL